MGKLLFTILSLAFLLPGCIYPTNRDKYGDNHSTSNIVYLPIKLKGTTIMALVNTRFCRPSEDGKTLIYAPVALPPKLGAPSDEEYLAANWYYNDVEAPVPPDGQQVASVTYSINGDATIATYIYEDVPKPVRIFSKLQLETALFKAGVLATVDAFIDAQTITNKFGQQVPLRRFYDTANEFHDDHPLFEQYVKALQQHLGWTDEQVEEILKAGEAL